MEEVKRTYEVCAVRSSPSGCVVSPCSHEIDPEYLLGRKPFMSIESGPRYEVVRKYHRQEEENNRNPVVQPCVLPNRRRQRLKHMWTICELIIAPGCSGINVIHHHPFHKLTSWLSPYWSEYLIQLQNAHSFSSSVSSLEHQHPSMSESCTTATSSTSLHSGLGKTFSSSPSIEIVHLDVEQWDTFHQALVVHPKGYRSLCTSSPASSKTHSHVIFITVQVHVKHDTENDFSSSSPSSHFRPPTQIHIRVPLIPLASSYDGAVETSLGEDMAQQSDNDDDASPSRSHAKTPCCLPHPPAASSCRLYILDMNFITPSTHLILQEKGAVVLYPARRHRCKSFPQHVIGSAPPGPSVRNAAVRSHGGYGVEEGVPYGTPLQESEGNAKRVSTTDHGEVNSVGKHYSTGPGMKRQRSPSPPHYVPMKEAGMEVTGSAVSSASGMLTADKGVALTPRLGIHYHRLIFLTKEDVQRLEAVEAEHNVAFELVICSADTKKI